MPFFRVEENYTIPYDVGSDDAERLLTALWLYRCGWERDAFHILHSIATTIKDENPLQEEKATYEETRFVKEEGLQQAIGSEEGFADARHRS